MPQRHEHLRRAQENESLAVGLLGEADKPYCTDWAITLLFYSAVHWVDGYLAQKNQRPTSHLHRDTIIETNGSLTAIYRDYRRLKDMSEEARYNIACYGKKQWDIAHTKLKAIKNHISHKL